MEKSKTSENGYLVLARDIVLAEIIIGGLLFVFSFLADYQRIYPQTPVGRLIRYDHFLIVAVSFLQVLATLFVFWRWHSQHYERRLSILDLILSGEAQHLELKQTFRWDAKEKKLNKGLEKTVMKTIAGFLNSEGGKIIIGVADDKSVHGLEDDYKTLVKANRDGFENHFNQTLNSVIGVRFRRFVRVFFESIDRKDVCLIEVLPADEPVYINLSNNTEEFFIRTGNTTTPLPVSKVTDYIKSRWA